MDPRQPPQPRSSSSSATLPSASATRSSSPPSSERSGGWTTARGAVVRAAAARSETNASPLCRGRPTVSTANGSSVVAVDRAADATTTSEAPLVGVDAIRAAAAALRGVATRTPLVPFGPSSDRRFLKAESLQPIGAFKIRGAYVAVASLSDEQRRRGVITYSSGNHAQGVARAARILGSPAVVVMPSDAPALKRARVEADGAEVIVVGPSSDERQQVAEALAAQRALTIIPPFDDDRLIAGQ